MYFLSLPIKKEKDGTTLANLQTDPHSALSTLLQQTIPVLLPLDCKNSLRNSARPGTALTEPLSRHATESPIKLKLVEITQLVDAGSAEAFTLGAVKDAIGMKFWEYGGVAARQAVVLTRDLRIGGVQPTGCCVIALSIVWL